MPANRLETREPRARDRIEIDVPGKGPHPAIVLFVGHGYLALAGATSTPLSGEEEIVRVDSYPQFATMDLNPQKTTLFYMCHVQPKLWLGTIMDVTGKCPPSEFKKLFAAYERVCAEARAGTRTIVPIPASAAYLVTRMTSAAAPASAAVPPVGAP